MKLLLVVVSNSYEPRPCDVHWKIAGIAICRLLRRTWLWESEKMINKLLIMSCGTTPKSLQLISDKPLNIAEGAVKVTDYTQSYPNVDRNGQANLIRIAHTMAKAFQSNSLTVWRRSDRDSTFFLRSYFTKKQIHVGLSLHEFQKNMPSSAVQRAEYEFKCLISKCKEKQVNKYGFYDYLVFSTIDKTERASIR